jgi:hypothetical protein
VLVMRVRMLFSKALTLGPRGRGSGGLENATATIDGRQEIAVE